VRGVLEEGAAMNQAETIIMNRILLAVGSRLDCWVWRNNVGAFEDPKHPGRWIRFGVPGSADILGMLIPSGRMLGIEVKTPTGQLDEKQLRWRTKFIRSGGLYILARSEEQCVRELNAGVEGAGDGNGRGEARMQQGSTPHARQVGRVASSRWPDGVPGPLLGRPTRGYGR
jgi:hypothetical protein